MKRMVGFAIPSHPFAHDRAARWFSEDLLAVTLPAADDTRVQHYKAAVHWCSAGAFLPVPWRATIREAAVDAPAAKLVERLRRAVVEIGSTVEFAFRFDQQALENDDLDDVPAGVSEGRAYLKGLQKRHPVPLTLLRRRVERAASGRAFDVPSIRAEQGSVEGMLSCAIDDAGWFAPILANLAATGPHRGTVEGPVPPFGTAQRSLAAAGVLARGQEP
jgi:hypothetical protein